MRFPKGHPVRVAFTKWGGLPHWEFDGVYLGEDVHGEWIGHRWGTYASRPGNGFASRSAWLTLVPADGRAHLDSFYAPEHPTTWIYVDMTDVPHWDGDVIRAIDLDLDVIHAKPEHDRPGIFIDDEDEFAEHQVSLGYPPTVIAWAEKTAAEVLAAVRSAAPPFDGTADQWFAVLGQLAQT